MSVTYKGQTFTSIQDFEYLPDEGFFYTYRMTGEPGRVYSDAGALKNLGYDVWTTRAGPYVELTARRNRADSHVTFIDRWTVASEILEKDLYSLPAAVAEIQSFPAGRAYYRRGIENAIKGKTNLDSNFSSVSQPMAYKILEELRRGVQVFEHEYTIMTRTRTFDFTTTSVLPGPLQLQSNRTIYTTAQIDAIEGIPDDVLFSLPTDTLSPPEQTIYGWRIRDQQAEITDTTTGVHRTSWVYAAWSTFLYELYS